MRQTLEIEAAVHRSLMDGSGREAITVAIVTDPGSWQAYQLIIDGRTTDALAVNLEAIPHRGRLLTAYEAEDTFRSDQWLWRMMSRHLGKYDPTPLQTVVAPELNFPDNPKSLAA